MRRWLLLLLTTPAFAQDARVLLVGNSYTAQNDLGALMRQVLQDDGADVSVSAWSPGGRTFAQHLADAQADTDLRRLLVTDGPPWDLVVLQDQSQIPGFPPTQPEWIASRDGAVGLDDLAEAAGADTLFFVTWGRRDGDPPNAFRFPDYPTMQDRLDEGYAAFIAATTRPDRPTGGGPVGAAFREARDRQLDFAGLFDGDGSHPSLRGSYLAALVLSSAWTGLDPRGVAFVPAGLDAVDAAALRDVAAAVTWDAPLGPWPLPFVVPWTAWTTPDGLPPISVAGSWRSPLVVADVDVEVATLRVGDGGPGRLWITGGALDAAQLTVGDEGSIRVVDGVARFPAASGAGPVELIGGTLSIAGEAPVAQTGGLLRPGATLGALSQTGGVLELRLGATTTPVAASGPVSLAGTLDLVPDGGLTEGDRVTLLTAPSLAWTGTLDAPADVTVLVEDGALIAVLGELPEGPTPVDPDDVVRDALQEALCGGCSSGGEAFLLLPLWAGLRRPGRRRLRRSR